MTATDHPLVAMLVLLFLQILAGLSLVGMGQWTSRLPAIAGAGEAGILEMFWRGLCVVILVAGTWHLFFPADGTLAALVLAFGLWPWIRNGARRRRLLAGVAREGLPFGILLGLAAFWIATVSVYRTIDPLYDFGLYYEQTIRWNREFRAVPGLANLHDRLGFGSGIHLLEGIVNPPALRGRAIGALSALLVLVVGAGCLRTVIHGIRGGGSGSAKRIEFLVAAITIPGLAARVALSCAGAPDLAVFVLQVQAVLFLAGAEGAGQVLSRERVFDTLSCAAAAVAVKLSSVVFSACLSVVVFFLVIHPPISSISPISPGEGIRAVMARTWKRTSGGLVFAIVLLVVWSLRGIVLSGYPLFPAPILRVPVPWAVPMGVAEDGQARAIRTWARSPGPGHVERSAGWTWFMPWARRNSVLGEFPRAMALVIAAGIAWAVTVPRRGMARDTCDTGDGAYLAPLLWGVLLVSVVFWFLAAPDPRFAGACWILLTSLSLRTLAACSSLRERTLKGVVLIIIVFAIGNYLRGSRWCVQSLLHLEQPPAIPNAVTRAIPVAGGGIVHVPLEGDRCWNSALPCSPGIPTGLRFRRQGSLGAGFEDASK